MPFGSIKQTFWVPIKAICNLLICALLCIGLNLNSNANTNIGATDAETIAVSKLIAHINSYSIVTDNVNDAHYASYLECASDDHDLSLKDNDAMSNVEVRNRFGACVNTEGYLEYGDVLDSVQPMDVVIFSVGGDERVTIRPYAAPVKVKVNIEYSARGYDGFEQEIEISSLFSSASFEEYEISKYGYMRQISAMPEFEMGTEKGDGSFYLEPGKSYIASVQLCMSQIEDTNGVPAAPITIQGMYVCLTDDMQTELPISEYDDNFLDSDLGGYFRRVIENY